MGNQQQAIIEHQPFKSSHPLYQDAHIIKEGGKNYIQSRLPVQDKEYDIWKEAILNTKSPLNHQFLLLPQHTGYQHDKEMCSKSGTAINNYPYFPNSLADQIKRRKPENAFFKESELWYLFYGLVRAKNDLATYGGRIGDIRPENVFIDNNGNVKIASILSSPRETNAFTKAKDYQNPNLNVFLAPQDLADLVKNSIDNKGNNQSQIFAVGLTVLSAGLLDDCRGIYNYKKLQFNRSQLELRKDHWSEHSKYSQIFKSIILNLVDENPSKRIKGDDLYKFISKYESAIKAKEQFIITHPPENLQTGVSIVRSKIH